MTFRTLWIETGPMRILHLLSQTELTGAEVYAQTLIEQQVRDGHQVFVISDRMHVPLPITPKSLPISSSRFFTRLQSIQEIRRFLKTHQIEVIHCHSRGAVRHAHWARLGLKVAQVTTIHGRQHFSWSKRLMNIYGDILIAICENAKLAMARDFHMNQSPIRIIRNPIAPFSATPARSFAQTPQALSTSLKIALIGRSSGPKGRRFESISEHCFEKWLKQKPDLKITIIAPKPEVFSSSFHERVKNLNLKYPGAIEVKGHVENLRTHLSDFDLVLASGRIAMECLFAKTPVFAIGEFDSHGILTPETLPESLESNFGDIGSGVVEEILDLPKITDQVSSFLSGARPSSEDLEKLRHKAEIEFSSRLVHDAVMEAYRAAIFKRHVPHWIPALMYHKIPDTQIQTQHRIFVTKDRFQKHLDFFKARGFQSLTFQDLTQFWTGKKPYDEFPKKPLLLTFDDGYKDNLVNAQKILKDSGFRAVIFLLANHSIIENTWDSATGEAPAELMSLEEKMQLNPQVWEIGSHGLNHLHLPEVSEAEARREMEESKSTLKRDLQQPVYSFAYPFGSTNAHIAELAREAGYKFAVNTDQGGLHLADQPHSIFRVNVFPEDGNFELWKKTSSWYRRYFFRKRGR